MYTRSIAWRSKDTANPISSLSYPFLDSDGSLWTADFLRGNLLRYAPDGSKVTVTRDVIKTATCNKCHQDSAKQDWVFTQNYNVLPAAAPRSK